MSFPSHTVQFTIKAGSEKTLSLIMTDACGVAINMTCATKYNTGKWKVWQRDGTLLIDGTLVFSCRTAGQVQYTTTLSDTVIANAGIWEGEVEISNMCCPAKIIEQSETFDFTIARSY